MLTSLGLIVAGMLVIAGSVFAAIAALGLLRLPDVYCRMHSASKAGVVGSGMILLALAIVANDTGEVLRAIVAISFLILTTPIAAHLLARAAYCVGYGLWDGSVLDEMAGVQIDGSGKTKPGNGYDRTRQQRPEPATTGYEVT